MSATHAEDGADLLGTCVMSASEYRKPIMCEVLKGDASLPAADRRCDTNQRIDRDRDGAEVVVKEDETILNKGKRTRLRAAGRPQKSWMRKRS